MTKLLECNEFCLGLSQFGLRAFVVVVLLTVLFVFIIIASSE